MMLTSLKKLPLLLGRKDAYQLGGLFAAILGMVFVEIIGIASILPFMHLVANPDLVHENDWLSWAYQTGRFHSQRSMLIWTGVAVLVLFAVSRSFAAFTTWLIHKSVWSIAHRLCMRLLENYARLPYEFFLTHNTSELLKKVVIDVNNFVSGVLAPGCYFVAYAILSLVVFLLMVVVQPLLAVTAFGVFGGAYALIFLCHHGHLQRLGKERLSVLYTRLHTFSDTISGMKTIRIEDVAPHFINRFEVASERFSQIHPRYQLVLTTPRFAIELLAFGAILTTILTLLSRGSDISHTIPVLSLFAMASYRLLPALTKTFSSAVQLSHHLPVVDDVCSDMHVGPQGPQAHAGSGREALGFDREIRLQGVSYRYERSEVDVVSGIDLSIPKHTSVALVGSTGAGKSTLIDLMVGLIEPTEGAVLVDDTPITAQNAVRWWRSVAYVPQEVFLYDETVMSNIAFGVKPHQIDIDRVREAARIAQIDDFVSNELPEGYNTTIGERGVRLSGGQRQRLGLARAFYRQPQVLFLDEATSALDGLTERAVMSALTTELPHMTVIMIAHRLSTIRHCQRIYLVKQGRLAAEGSYDDLMVENQEFKQMVQLTS